MSSLVTELHIVDENNNLFAEAAFVSSRAADDVYHFFIFRPDRGGVRGIKLQDQLSDRGNEKRASQYKQKL